MLLAAASALPAQSKLHLRVFTSGANGFSVNSTLIYGDRDAILVDTQFVRSEAYRVAAMILESKKNLTTVYITHGHPDHYFGIAVLKQAFPNAKFVALPATIAAIRNGWEGRLKFWTPEFGFNLPTTGPILPDELQGNALNLEGHALQVVGGVTGDGPNNSYVWIPSLRAVIAGDIVFSGAYFTPPKMPEDWLKTLDQIADLKPITVIPGHERAGARNDASTIAFHEDVYPRLQRRARVFQDRRGVPVQINQEVSELRAGAPDRIGSRCGISGQQKVASAFC